MKNLIKKFTAFSLCLICFSSCFTYTQIKESKQKDFNKNFTPELFEVKKRYLIITEDQTKIKLQVNEISKDKLIGTAIQKPNFTGKHDESELVELAYDQMDVVKMLKFRPLKTLGIGTIAILGFATYHLNFAGIDLGW